MAGKKQNVQTRFWKRVKKSDPESCWEWQGGRFNTGYGVFNMNPKVMTASRASWILTHGEIARDQHVLHKCDNPPCVNPNHLFIGIHNENTADKVAKNRQAKGEEAGSAKLTNEKVRAIRLLAKITKTSNYKLGELYSMSHTAIGRILSGKTWAHLLEVTP